MLGHRMEKNQITYYRSKSALYDKEQGTILKISVKLETSAHGLLSK